MILFLNIKNVYPFVVMYQEKHKTEISIWVFYIVINCQPVSQSQSLQLLSADPVKTFFVSPLKHVKKHFSKNKWQLVKNVAGEIFKYTQKSQENNMYIYYNEIHLAFLQHRRSFRKDTVNIHTPDGTRVSIISAKPFSIDRVPNIRNLKRQCMCKNNHKNALKKCDVVVVVYHLPDPWPLRTRDLPLCCIWSEWWTSHGPVEEWVSIGNIKHECLVFMV